jgi:prepilin-type N-terminal cleavage/methylation domain-containing protein
MRSCTRARSPVSGFTLIELMMVVAILGILAVVAIPRYKSYLYRSKTTEAVGFLAEIKSRQESYRADFGQYCAINGDSGSTFYPSSRASDGTYAWEAAPTALPGAGYRQLGAYPPSGRTLFQYQVIAGPPGATAPQNLGFNGSDFWFVSRAQADLDGDGTTMLMEGYSAASSVYVFPPSGYE